MTDKELIKLYLKKKGVKRHAFSVSLGFSKNFLDNGDTITTVNLRKIINHPDYVDFNLKAFIEQDAANILRKPDELSDEVVNHGFIYDITEEIGRLKADKDKLTGEEIERVFEILALMVKRYSALSQDHTKFYNFIKKQAGL